MKYSCLITIFLFSSILFSQSIIPEKIDSCLIIKSKCCDCLDSLLSMNETLPSVIAYSYYFKGYFCSKSSESLKKDNFYKNLAIWDSTGYRGYRYLFSNLNIANYFYNEYYNFDSIQKYTNKGLAVEFENKPGFANNHMELTNVLANGYQREGDIQKAIELISSIEKENKHDSLNSEHKAWYYYYFASLIADQDADNYNKLVDSLSDLSTTILDNSTHRLLHRNRFNIARNLQKHESKDSVIKALNIYKEYYYNYLLSKNSEKENALIKFKANCANAIGECHQILGNHEVACQWFERSIEYFSDFRGAFEYSYSPFINASKSYQQLGFIDSSQFMLNLAIKEMTGGKSTLANIDSKLLSESTAPLQTLNIMLEIANTFSLSESIELKQKAVSVFEQTIALFHHYFNKLEVTKSKYWKKKEFAKVFDNLISTASKMNDPYLLFNAIDYNKHSFVSTQLENKVSLKQTNIEENVLQFAILDSNLHMLFIKEGELGIKKIMNMETLSQLIDDYYLHLSTNGNRDSIQHLSLKLSSYLINHDWSNTTEISIIPSANLDKIPFDCLYENNTLMINNRTINYQLSNTIINQLKNRNYSSSEGVALMSPTFKKNPNNLYATIRGTNFAEVDLYHLPFAETEVNNISSQLNTKPKDATKQNFIDALSKHQIVHFSGHAISIQSESDESFLAFDSDIHNSNNVLTQQEIYDLQSKNDLIVLSACQTASGEYLQNEGTLSLARAFIYAGAKSVISTLWSVNDRSTSIIMTEFYKELLKGKRKDEALRLAKLSYLEKADPEYQHPYYWAGFIAMGDMSPLFYPNKKYYFGGIALLSLAFLVLVYKKKFSPSRLAA